MGNKEIFIALLVTRSVHPRWRDRIEEEKNIMYAVIRNRRKSSTEQEGDVITVEKLDAKAGDKVTLIRYSFSATEKK